jgi:hypothetical protein
MVGSLHRNFFSCRNTVLKLAGWNYWVKGVALADNYVVHPDQDARRTSGTTYENWLYDETTPMLTERLDQEAERQAARDRATV